MSDDFVFKTAAVSPKSQPEPEILNNHLNNSSSTQKLSPDPSTSTNSFSVSTAVNHDPPSVTAKTMRFPDLDAFVSEKRKEMDSELSKLGKARFEEFLKREREADKLREEELASSVASIATSPKTLKTRNSNLDFNEIDEKEKEMFKEMRSKATETWTELETEYKNNLAQLHTEQSARLAQESQLQESLKAAGSVFDRELFDAIIDKCGKGKSTAFGKEKMSRFWEVLERIYPKNSSPRSPSNESEDKLLASLLGI